MWRTALRKSYVCGAGIVASVFGFLTYVPEAAGQG